MSDRRYDVLEAIRRDPRASIRELCESTGIKSPSTLWYHLNKLEDEGAITRAAGARGIHLGKVHVAHMRVPQNRRRKNATLSVKRQTAGMAGRGEDAFIPKKSKMDTGLQKRIERVVRKAVSGQQSAVSNQWLDDARVVVLRNGVKVVVKPFALQVSDLK